jgi:hypothetical protein
MGHLLPPEFCTCLRHVWQAHWCPHGEQRKSAAAVRQIAHCTDDGIGGRLRFNNVSSAVPVGRTSACSTSCCPALSVAGGVCAACSVKKSLRGRQDCKFERNLISGHKKTRRARTCPGGFAAPGCSCAPGSAAAARAADRAGEATLRLGGMLRRDASYRPGGSTISTDTARIIAPPRCSRRSHRAIGDRST